MESFNAHAGLERWWGNEERYELTRFVMRADMNSAYYDAPVE